MSKFYSFISEGVTASRMNMTKEFISSHFIFVPFIDTYGFPDGTFVSSKDVFWYDPTGCFDKIREVLQCGQRVEVDSLPCQCLSSVYPGLHDFFVQVCNVPEVPPFGTYLQLLQLLSSVALPSQAAQAVSSHKLLQKLWYNQAFGDSLFIDCYVSHSRMLINAIISLCRFFMFS